VCLIDVVAAGTALEERDDFVRDVVRELSQLKSILNAQRDENRPLPSLRNR